MKMRHRSISIELPPWLPSGGKDRPGRFDVEKRRHFDSSEFMVSQRETVTLLDGRQFNGAELGR